MKYFSYCIYTSICPKTHVVLLCDTHNQCWFWTCSAAEQLQRFPTMIDFNRPSVSRINLRQHLFYFSPVCVLEGVFLILPPASP